VSVLASVRYELRLQRRLIRRHRLLNVMVATSACAALARAAVDFIPSIHQVLS
jgi:hypothetical protein